MATENSSFTIEENEEESSSVLGTKNFWDLQYVIELENFKDHGDIGEIWFGKKVMDSIVKWTTEKFEKNINILDLGCGNGVLLIQLAQKGFENLVGVDYSESAIILANTISESRQAKISYKTMDVLSEGAVGGEDHGKYNLLLDKGTFDAISLMEDFGSAVRDRYLKATSSLLKEDGLFLMATCNWTIDEIVQHMATYYSRTEVIPTPSMQFGGQQGNKVSVVVFRKNMGLTVEGLVRMLLVSKICSAILLAVIRLLAGLLPLKVHRKMEKWSSKSDGQSGSRRRDRVEISLSMFLCFGAGLLLSTCFVHMIPEVRTSFVQASKVGDWPLLELYPFAEVVICIGFFAVYLLEEMGEKMIKHEPPTEGKAHEMERSKSQSLLGIEMGNQRRNSHHHSHGDHTHAHGPALSADEQKSIAAAIRGFLLVAALSFHSIFEGMAIGLQPTLSDVWFLFTAVIVHELAIMFCIGMEMLASKLRVLLYVIYMVELGLITSVGVGIGILVTEYVHDPSATHLLVIAILQGIAAGTLLYVTFLEVLERERHKPGNGLAKLLAIAIGFFLLTIMETLTGQHEPIITNTMVMPVNSSIALEEMALDLPLVLNATLS